MLPESANGVGKTEVNRVCAILNLIPPLRVQGSLTIARRHQPTSM